MADKDSQEEEISALKSIYIENDLLEYDSNLSQGVFCAKVTSASNQFELEFGNFYFFSIILKSYSFTNLFS